MSETKSEVGQLLGAVAAIDRRAAVFCACQCARTVLHVVPAHEDKPRRAIEAAEAWLRGEGSKKACRDAANEAVASDISILQAALAASYAAQLAALPPKDTQGAVGWISEIPRAVATASTDSKDPDWAGTYERNLAALLGVVQALQWLLTVPTPAQLSAAPQGIQVAWDALGESKATAHTIPQLVEAHERAKRLGLDWSDPVQRAITERIADEAGEVRIRELLDV